MSVLAYRRGNASPAMAISWRGVTSSSTASFGGNSASDSTRCPHSTRPAEIGEHGNEGVGDPLRATTRQRPSDDVSEYAEHQPVARGDRRPEGEERVPGEAGEQCPRLVGGESMLGDGVCREDPDRAEASHRERMLRRHGQGRQEPVGEPEPGVHQRLEQPSVCPRIAAEGGRGVVDRAVQDRGAPSVEWMGQRHVGMDPFQAVRAERSGGFDLTERRRSDGERMDRRADVVNRSRDGEFLRARATARAGSRFVDRDVPTGARQRDRRHQPVRAGTDDDSASVHAPADDFTPRTAVSREERMAWRIPPVAA